MMSNFQFIFLGAAYAGRFAMHAVKKVNWQQVQKAMPALPEISLNAYYKGGFESKMSKREASLVLGKYVKIPSYSRARVISVSIFENEFQ